MRQTASTAPDWSAYAGLQPYRQTEAAMAARVAAIRAGTQSEAVWLLEHPPLYTAGTSAVAAELRAPDRFPTYRTGRGGQWTYHGPGQRLAYVMLDLQRGHGAVPPRDVRAYVGALEQWLIGTLAAFRLVGERRAGRVGIWIADPATGQEAKIAAIGVRVTRWVTWHGVALNVCPALEHFSGIVPCGIVGHGVTSLHAQGVAASMAEVDGALQASWRMVFEEQGA